MFTDFLLPVAGCVTRWPALRTSLRYLADQLNNLSLSNPNSGEYHISTGASDGH
jgi:hypothetical protein